MVTPPRHKQNPGTVRERAQRAKQHAQHRKHKQGRKTTPPSAVAQRYAQTWVLFTTASTVAQAVAEYAGRMSIEETYRDWHHHWAVRAAVVAMPTEAMVARLIGIVCLAYTVQMHLGQRVSADPVGQRRRAQWTVTDRVSWFWCGQRLFATRAMIGLTGWTSSGRVWGGQWSPPQPCPRPNRPRQRRPDAKVATPGEGPRAHARAERPP